MIKQAYLRPTDALGVELCVVIETDPHTIHTYKISQKAILIWMRHLLAGIKVR